MGNRDFQIKDLMNKPFPLIGKPFKDMGRGPDNYDCWGLVMEAFKRQGIVLPDYGKGVWADQSARIDKLTWDASKDWTPIKKPIPGCLVVLRFPYPNWASHFGMMLDTERFLNIRIKTRVLATDRITSPAWKKRIAGFYIYNG